MSAKSKETHRHRSPLAALMPAARQRLVELGTPLLLTETEGRLALAERKIAAFERKYKTTLASLYRDGLPDDASMAMHEDFVEWSGWQRTYEEASQTLAALPPLLEQSLVASAAS
jgi:hypothetical protein